MRGACIFRLQFLTLLLLGLLYFPGVLSVVVVVAAIVTHIIFVVVVVKQTQYKKLHGNLFVDTKPYLRFPSSVREYLST